MIDINSLTQNSNLKETKNFKSLEELRAWLAEDFERFVLYANQIEGLKTGKIQLFLARKLMEGHRILEFLIFRNSTKTWICDLWVCWKLLCFSGFTFIIVSAKHDAGKKHMNNFRRLFRTLPALSHMKWATNNENSFRIEGSDAQEPTLRIESIYSASLTGSHIDIMILDDVAILQTEETENKRSKLRNMLSSNVYPVVNPNDKYFKHLQDVPQKHRTNILYVGTPWLEQSILLFNPDKSSEDQEGADEGGHPLMDAHRVIIPALDNNNQSNFPEKYSNLQFDLQKRSMSKPAWALHMLLDPSVLDKESLVVNIDDIVKKTVSLNEPICTVDPAGEDGTGDEHAFTILGSYYDKEAKANKIHVKHINGFNVKANDFVDSVLNKCKEQGVWKIYIESKFNSYRTLFENRIQQMGSFATIEKWNPKGNKHKRLIEMLDPNINNGTVTFDPSVLEDKATLKQFRNFTYKSLPSYDDRLDSLAMGIDVLLESIKQSTEFTLDVTQYEF